MALPLNEPFLPPPGIQKDRTPYSSPFCTDGEWSRFYETAPMSMLGYATLDLGENTIVRSMSNLPVSTGNEIYMGRYNSVKCIDLDYNGINQGVVDRTPAGFTGDVNNTLWSFTNFANSGSRDPVAPFGENVTYIVATPTKDALNFQGETEQTVYAGKPQLVSPLLPLVTGKNDDSGHAIHVTSSGGVATIGNVLVSLKKAGYIAYSQPGQIDNWTDKATDPSDPTSVLNLSSISDTKIIRAMPTPGAENPTGLFWSLNSIERATYFSPSTDFPGGTWVSQTLQTNTSLLSPNSVVQYNQEFFWVGTSQFYRYNGVVQAIPNPWNSQFFFDYMHWKSRGRCWATSNPRYGEIWFYFPRKDTKNTPDSPTAEVNHAVVYNVMENAFYDTPVSRSAGIPPSFFEYPVWADSTPVEIPYESGSLTSYPIWQHEIGEDKIMTVEGNAYRFPIKKSITFPRFSAFQKAPENNRSLRVYRVELDLVQQGEMNMWADGRKWARSDPQTKGPFTFDSDTLFVDNVYSQGRIINFKFESNTQGGFYHFGNITVDYQLGSMVP